MARLRGPNRPNSSTLTSTVPLGVPVVPTLDVASTSATRGLKMTRNGYAGYKTLKKRRHLMQGKLGNLFFDVLQMRARAETSMLL